MVFIGFAKFEQNLAFIVFGGIDQFIKNWPNYFKFISFYSISIMHYRENLKNKRSCASPMFEKSSFRASIFSISVLIHAFNSSTRSLCAQHIVRTFSLNSSRATRSLSFFEASSYRSFLISFISFSLSFSVFFIVLKAKFFVKRKMERSKIIWSNGKVNLLIKICKKI